MNTKEELIEIRNSTGMNRREFAEYFGIPYRTVQDRELGNRNIQGRIMEMLGELSKITSQSRLAILRQSFFSM